MEPFVAFSGFVVIEYVLQPAGYFKTLYSRLLTSETPRLIPFLPCVNPTVVRLKTLSPLLCYCLFSDNEQKKAPVGTLGLRSKAIKLSMLNPY